MTMRTLAASVLSSFDAQVALRPEQAAIVAANASCSYAALQIASEQWAQRVLESAPHSTAPVALLFEHDAPLVAALLGVLRTGRPYLALNPHAPRAQQSQFLRDAAPDLLLTDTAFATLSRALAREHAIAPVVREEFSAHENRTRRAAPEISASTPACLFYTSGSTGTPKGILQNHGCLSHTAHIYAATLGLAPQDRVVWAVAASVGASSSVIFGALVAGATLYAFDLKARGPTALRSWMRQTCISVFHCAPSVFRSVFEESENAVHLPALRVVKLGGEASTHYDAQLFQSALAAKRIAPGCRLFNGLGITEAGGNVCFYEVPATGLAEDAPIPVGFPAPDYELSLQDENGATPKAGEGGELIVSSDYLASGFWNCPDQTQAAFFTNSAGRRSYRSGDRARFNAAGALEYLGRMDQQVKIRGHRVELPAIEAALLALPQVRRAAVVFQENEASASSPQLIACLATDAATAALPESTRDTLLRHVLRQTLPDYMIPSRFIPMDVWPELPGSKLDRAALFQSVRVREPERDATRDNGSTPSAADPLENRLQGIWQRALKLRHVRVQDNFFALGGHSLAAAAITTAIHAETGLEIPLTALAEFPTISQLAAAIRTGKIGGEQRLLKLRDSNARAPLFCIPGAGGDAFALLAIGAHLPDEQSFYALQPPGLNGLDPFPATIEGFADFYLETIRRHQPRGPYFLSGISLGGVIMFEVARRLQAQNEAIARLILIDSKAVGYPHPRRILGLKHPLAAVWQILPAQSKDSFAPRNIARGLREQLHYRQAGREIAAALPRPYQRRYLHLRLSNFAAKRSYHPGVFRGDLYLLAAENQPSSKAFVPDENLGWRPFVAGRVLALHLPFRHDALSSEPAASLLAETIATILSPMPARDASLP